MSIGKIGEFDVKNGAWSSYADRLEMYFKVNGVKEDFKLPTLISLMGDEAYELLVNLASPRKPAELTYTEASEILRHHLQPAPSVLAERYRFRQRRQRAGENVSEYVAELKKMARNCKFSEGLNENMRDQFVCGIGSDVIRQRLFAEDDSVNFAQAVKIASSLEAAERDAAAVEVRAVPEAVLSGAVHTLHTSGRTDQARRGRGNSAKPHWTAGQARTALANCKGCGATGHDYGNCRFRDYVCSRCKRPGHLRRVCSAWGAGTDSGSRSSSMMRRGATGGLHFGNADPEEQGRNSEEDSVDLHQLNLRDYKPI